ncbi:hypothetical protein TNCV_4342621 [Trichonephila clavipes]|nr:hypothetical protein TNCV_4342621 [Trichonephila clavipes]
MQLAEFCNWKLFFTPRYHRDSLGDELYLQKNEGVNDEEQVIPFVYVKDASGNEKYPHDTQGNQIAFKAQDAKRWIYAIDKDKNAFYPTDNTEKDIVLGDYIYKNDGSFKYPLNKDGDPVYETDDTTNDEVYFIKNDGFINSGEDRKGNQGYAEKENRDEYYPANGEFACDHSGSPQYACTSKGEVIFPSDAPNNESYIKDDLNGGSHVIYMGDVLLDRYAKTSNGEKIYLIQITNQTS